MVPPPRAKVLSRFPLKRNSFDRAAFGVELKSARDRVTPSSNNVKKEEPKTNGNTTTEDQQPPTSIQTESSPAKAESDSTPSTALTNGTQNEEGSVKADPQTSGSSIVVNEQKGNDIVENGRSDRMCEKDQEDATAKVVANTSQVEESKKATITRKTPLRKSVKKKSPTSADRLPASEGSQISASLPPTIENGTEQEEADVQGADITESKTDSSPVNHGDLLTSSSNETPKSETIEVSVDVKSSSVAESDVPCSAAAADIGSSSLSVASLDERVPDDIEEVSSTSTLTPAPSEERELVQSTTTATTTASFSIATTAVVTTSASAVTTSTVSASTSTSSSLPPHTRPDVHNTMNSVSNSSDFDTATSNGHCSRKIVPVVSDVTEDVAAASTEGRGTPASTEPATSPLDPLVQTTPSLTNNPSNANKVLMPKVPSTVATDAERSSAAETGAVPKEFAAAKPPKPEGSSSGAIEKESVVKNVKNATTSAIGKTLQKPLNLAQKILEAALQVKIGL